MHEFAAVPTTLASGSALGHVTAFTHAREAAISAAAVQLAIAEMVASAADAAADAAGEGALARVASHREAGLQLDSARLGLADAVSQPESDAAAVVVNDAAAAVDIAARALALAEADAAKAGAVQCRRPWPWT